MGSETSQYHEEKKLKSILQVAASENREAQTPHQLCILENSRVQSWCGGL